MERPIFQDMHPDGHVFTRIGSDSRPSRTTRAWTSNGVHYTLDTANYSSPGFSFGTMTGSAGTPFRNPRPSTRAVGGASLLASAFGLFDDILSIQQAHRHGAASNDIGQGFSNARRVTIEEPTQPEDDLIYDEPDEDRSRPRSMFARIKDKLADGNRRIHQQHEYSHSHSRESSRDRSPVRRPRAERRPQSYRTDFQRPSWAESHQNQPPFTEGAFDTAFEEVDPRVRNGTARTSSPPDTRVVDALTEAADVERRAVRSCKKRLESALRQPGVSSHHLQQLVTELKRHEEALAAAQTNLGELTARKRRSRHSRTSAGHPRGGEPASAQRPKSAGEEPILDPFAGLGGPFFAGGQSRHPDPIFQAFEDLNSFGPFARASFGLHESFFERARQSMNHPQFHFHSSGGFRAAPRPHTQTHTHTQSQSQPQHSKRTRHSVPNFDPRAVPGFGTFTVPTNSKPSPPNLLKAAEARSLFQTYEQRWNAISNTDMNIPYPARGLQANGLMARDTIWAPLCRADVVTWSEETVMQANAQAFYLGVVGLAPVYREAPGTGSIEMGFDKGKASTAQVEELIGILKKEKTRWHSDRLGRRNGGSGTMNEALQKDERARAVFHAVCGLMESAQ